MNLYGPINSGVAVGADGVATNNATGTTAVAGEIRAVYVRYNDSPPAGTTDVTVATEGTNHPAVTILTLANAATNGWFYPRVALATNAGVAVTYDGTRPIYGSIPIADKIKVTIAQANAADSVDVWLLVD